MKREFQNVTMEMERLVIRVKVRDSIDEEEAGEKTDDREKESDKEVRRKVLDNTQIISFFETPKLFHIFETRA